MDCITSEIQLYKYIIYGVNYEEEENTDIFILFCMNNPIIPLD